MKLASFALAVCPTAKYILELLPMAARACTSLNGILIPWILMSEIQDQGFVVGGAQYLAVTSNPVFIVPYVSEHFRGPIAYISALSATTTREELQQAINNSLRQDDIFVEGFLRDVLVSASGPSELYVSVINYLEGLGSSVTYFNGDGPSTCGISTLTPCPLFGITDGDELRLSKVQLLYPDTYRTFVTDTYESKGTYKSFAWAEASWGCQRIGVKDIYDIEGVQTTAGSQAYAARIVDLGGFLVGKQKTAQCASPAHAWNWNNAYYPRNPRGDTFLSFSASSSGAGCSIAAYDWLDFAIGTDTGLSVRQPAAFSGTYGNRPSRGMILMENVVTNAHNTDIVGVFARGPAKWAAFAKVWCDPSLHQHTSLNGLPALSLPDDRSFLKRILYPVDHLPLQNPAAETILQMFLVDASAVLGATVEHFNLSATVEGVAGRPLSEVLGDLSVLWIHDLITETAEPLLAKYAPGFPPLDKPYRQVFHSSIADDVVYKAA
ncbi:glutamyl-tRNA(Gln) amidotransferase subunit A [Colletotrichum spaethianum]|uniref:Glutamyl-tRNA(Gln) amidotransferase subunit A n=1 Tax=Colletotrichum spaethianum TaxID=700344 RepID=A0AA37UQM6_9PEZI|nr:glutamyl-tRNA(Gln) amidotransferase subunit A [Colletotrichum spaethianum]GKT49037.1 glutamyl-tRNA(Gln) amidotransferase subunit A [Colletotrichum spaethianum]